ncbi:orexin receptor type 2-like [Saccostrea echinata]|uniref:orexin receptor type 2-like n=1 Tax=Saccostrea echinata TaxID=191078 RepID=UPI002A809822|nr:orexin receptor type 2-like [Saccostrea echinata]
MALLMLIGITGNLMVCVVYIKKKFKCSTDFFILNLAFLDLLTCFFGIPVEIADLRFPYTFNAPAACKLFRTVESLTSMGSTLTLIGIAVDRYKRICRLGERFSNKTAKRICAGAVIIGVLTCWPAAVVFGKKSVDVGVPGIKGTDCSTDDSQRHTVYPLLYYGLVFLYFLICVVIVTFIYVRISIFIRRGKQEQIRRNSNRYEINAEITTTTEDSQETNAHASSTSGATKETTMVNTIKTSRTTVICIAITVAFIVSYLPFLVVMVTRNIKKNFEKTLSPPAEVFYKFCLKSYFINDAINPVIYSFLNKAFRQEVIRWFRCKASPKYRQS